MDYQLIAALAVLCALYYLHRRTIIRAYASGLDAGRVQGHITGLGEAERRDYQAGYHQGHEDGLAEGRDKAELERETAEYKTIRDYEQGWTDAMEAVQRGVYSKMHDGTTKNLSA